MLYKPVEAGCAAGLRKRTATEGSVEPWMMFDTVSLLQPETWIVGSGLRLFAARPKKTLETHSPRPREAGHGGRRWYGSTFFQRAPSFRKIYKHGETEKKQDESPLRRSGPPQLWLLCKHAIRIPKATSQKALSLQVQALKHAWLICARSSQAPRCAGFAQGKPGTSHYQRRR